MSEASVPSELSAGHDRTSIGKPAPHVVNTTETISVSSRVWDVLSYS